MKEHIKWRVIEGMWFKTLKLAGGRVAILSRGFMPGELRR